MDLCLPGVQFSAVLLQAVDADMRIDEMQEDELYDKQFGEAFAAQALDPNDRRSVLRDDYALEIAGTQLPSFVMHRHHLLVCMFCHLFVRAHSHADAVYAVQALTVGCHMVQIWTSRSV